MSVGAPLYEPPTTKSSRADDASYRRRQPGQRLDQPAGEASNESTKMGGEGRLEAGSRSKPCAAGPEAAAQQARRGGQLGGKRRWKEGVEDRKDGTRDEDRGAASSLYPGQAARKR
jgi:hypothetical protein